MRHLAHCEKQCIWRTPSCGGTQSCNVRPRKAFCLVWTPRPRKGAAAQVRADAEGSYPKSAEVERQSLQRVRSSDGGKSDLGRRRPS